MTSKFAQLSVHLFLLLAAPSILWAFDRSLPLSAEKQLIKLEVAAGGRIGISAFNIKNNKSLHFRSSERFPMCSTFKAFLAAAVLKKSIADHYLLEERIHFVQKDIETSGYAPITEKHLKDGMTVAELCEAMIQHSDNAAANLLMKRIGGPQAVTQFVRTTGDLVFRLDRWEPELNSAIPADLRDTSTPEAIEHSLRQILFSNTLGKLQRVQLENWMKGNTTGDKRMRAGVPKGWIVGDKTGTCAYGTTNDIGVIWSPTGDTIVAAIFFSQKSKDSTPKNEVIAEATKTLIQALSL